MKDSSKKLNPFLTLTKNLYSATEKAKSGDIISIFLSGRPTASRFDPRKQGERFISSIPEANFYLILGVLSGYEVLALQMRKDVKILAVETRDSLQFVRTLPQLKSLDKERVTLCTIEELSDMLKKLYIPAIYSKFSLVTLTAWENEIGSAATLLHNMIDDTLDIIKNDFVTQSQFGLQWQHNILINTKEWEKTSRLRSQKKVSPPNDKSFYGNKNCALVVAAGPTLNLTYKSIKKSDFLIATDTAYRTLMRHKTPPDIAITLDCQRASIMHYLGCVGKGTLYYIDIGGNHTLTKLLSNEGVHFTTSSHPLSCVPKKNGLPLLSLDTTSGTVTIAAIDLAKKLGFKKIRVLGADFSYIAGATYCRGTYLSDTYIKNNTRLKTLDSMEAAGLFRHKLEKLDSKKDECDNKRATKVLSRYKAALYSWAHSNGWSIEARAGEYLLEAGDECESPNESDPVLFKSTDDHALLPMVAFLKRLHGSEGDFFDYMAQAKKDYQLYTKGRTQDEEV